jgi:group I intron endonuclease
MKIYAIKNRVNGKIYVGLTTRSIEKRWKEHVSNYRKLNFALYRAFRKYGVENFSIEELENVDTLEELVKRETEWITQLDTMNPLKGYNMLWQDDHIKFFNDEVCKSISKGVKRFHSGRSPADKLLFYTATTKARRGRKTSNHRKYVGVYQPKSGINSYTCEITHNKKKYTKNFRYEEQAAEAYDRMALYLYGEDAKLNFEVKRSSYLLENLEEFADFFATPTKSGVRPTKYYRYSELLEENKIIAKSNVMDFINIRTKEQLVENIELFLNPTFNRDGTLIKYNLN